MTHPNLLGKKFPEHSLNIDLIEKLEEETDWFNKLHDANFVKWWWANPMNPGLNHNGGCTIITNQSYINFYSHFEIPSKRINKNILNFLNFGVRCHVETNLFCNGLRYIPLLELCPWQHKERPLILIFTLPTDDGL